MGDLPQLSLAEYVVLAVVDEAPTHGFAVAALTAQGGPLGRVWQIPRPVVYRSLDRLVDERLIRPGRTEAGKGPQRQVFRVTAAGRRAVAAWLATPVEHVRDLRSLLLMKLALLDRRRASPRELLLEQRETLAPIVESFGSPSDPPADGDDGHGVAAPASGFDGVLQAWRRANARAALDFLTEITPRA